MEVLAFSELSAGGRITYSVEVHGPSQNASGVLFLDDKGYASRQFSGTPPSTNVLAVRDALWWLTANRSKIFCGTTKDV